MAECSIKQKQEEESGGLDLSFLSTPPDDLVCSICLSVHREPVLTSCCGNHFCFSCVEQVRQDGGACPLCGALRFTTMLDKSVLRKVNELGVACRHKKVGCPWKGSVSDLWRHLDPEKGDCLYMQVRCPYSCGLFLTHSGVERHKKTCSKRPYACKFCRFEGVYEDMGTEHWKVCKKYPLPCPHNCGKLDIERRLMEEHLSHECTVHKKECEFAYAGCTHTSTSSNMSEHLASNVQHHLSLLSKHCLQLTESFSSEFRSQLEQEVRSSDSKLTALQTKLKKSENDISLLRSEIALLEDEVECLKVDNVNLRSIVFVPPFECVMMEFRELKQKERQWLSPAFYTHFGGYKMCISVDASGSEEGGGSHLSVYCNLMKGEYDDHLKWPFRGCISIELCNQRDTKGNFEEKIMFTYDASEIASRVTGGELAEHGLGIPTFIQHSQLGFHVKNNVEIQYLRNDSLRFRVLRVDLMMNRRNTGVKK